MAHPMSPEERTARDQQLYDLDLGEVVYGVGREPDSPTERGKPISDVEAGLARDPSWIDTGRRERALTHVGRPVVGYTAVIAEPDPHRRTNLKAARSHV